MEVHLGLPDARGEQGAAGYKCSWGGGGGLRLGDPESFKKSTYLKGLLQKFLLISFFGYAVWLLGS